MGPVATTVMASFKVWVGSDRMAAWAEDDILDMASAEESIF